MTLKGGTHFGFWFLSPKNLAGENGGQRKDASVPVWQVWLHLDCERCVRSEMVLVTWL